MAARETSRVKRIAEIVLIVLIVAVIGAIAARLLRYQRAMDTQPQWGLPNMVDHQMTIPGRPHDVESFLANPEGVKRRITYEFSTDSNGFRSEEVAREKPAGTFRIAAVGECVSFGQGVRDDQTWPAVLQRKLREAHPDRTIEVLNASQPVPPQNVLLLLREIPPFSPDVVVFSPGADTSYQMMHGQGEKFRIWLSKPEYREARRQYAWLLREAIELSRESGFFLIFVTPTTNTFFLPDVDEWIDEMTEVGRDDGVPVVDTTALFRERERRDGLVFRPGQGTHQVVAYRDGQEQVLADIPYTGNRYIAPAVYEWLDEHPDVSPALSIDENHPNPTGHELIATEVARVITEAGYLE